MSSRLYTRTGDKGSTSLLDGSRVSKDSLRVEVYGTVDEATSWVGAARAFMADKLLESMLEFLQHRLYNCSSNLAAPPGVEFDLPVISQHDVDWLENAMDFLQERTGELKSFVLPTGCKAAGLLHVARTVCRRAERRIARLVLTEPVDEKILKFINRTSDFLFIAARYANVLDGLGDTEWKIDLEPPSLK